MSTKRTYCTTQEELALAIGISPEEWCRKWSKRPGLPEKTSKGWDIQATIAWKAKWERDAAQKLTGPYSDLKRRKLAADAETSEVKLAAMKGDLIAREDMLAYVTRLGNVLQEGFQQAVALVKVQTGNAAMVKIMEGIRDEVLHKIADQVQAAK